MQIFCVFGACVKALFLFSFLTIPMAQASEWFEGENFITTFVPSHPWYERYEVFEKQESGWLSRLWQHQDRGFADSYVVNIVRGTYSDLRMFQASQDDPGRSSCMEFDSTVIDQSPRNGYHAMFWETRCRRDGIVIKSLQLAIAGNDSLYHLRKLWQSQVAEGDWVEWKNLISSAYVCDTRSGKHPCPEGFTKVP